MLKLSGEALAGDKKTGFDEETVRGVARQVRQLVDSEIEVGIVIGGGNFWRGRTSENIDRTKADQIGMLATIMNCIYVSEIFRSVGMDTEILTPFTCGSFTKLFSKDRANKYFKQGKVVFFAGGTGHPYFSTDTGVLLRAIEVDAEVVLLAKAIDGVYDSDPKVNPDAKKYDELTIQEVVDKNLQVVDMTASILARDNKMPMWVFSLNEENSIAKDTVYEYLKSSEEKDIKYAFLLDGLNEVSTETFETAYEQWSALGRILMEIEEIANNHPNVILILNNSPILR